MVKTKIVIASDQGERSNRAFIKKDGFGGLTDLLAMTAFLIVGIFIAGCSVPAAQIPGISQDHPAQKFYQAAQQGMLADRVCRDNQGDPAIPMGKIEKGEGFTKVEVLTAGVFSFRENATGKQYLGVSFMQYNGFLQIPKVCSWEEKNQG